MSAIRDTDINVTKHAIERFKERFLPDMPNVSDEVCMKVIRRLYKSSEMIKTSNLYFTATKGYDYRKTLYKRRKMMMVVEPNTHTIITVMRYYHINYKINTKGIQD